jgi:hypothetical protein
MNRLGQIIAFPFQLLAALVVVLWRVAAPPLGDLLRILLLTLAMLVSLACVLAVAMLLPASVGLMIDPTTGVLAITGLCIGILPAIYGFARVLDKFGLFRDPKAEK